MMKARILVLTLAVVSAGAMLAQSGGDITLPQDKGPDKLDVSAYPAPMQAAYKTFAAKCSKCHTLARPLNTSMTRAEWERYVKRMMHKPSSAISDKQGKEIFDFMAYDQENRKDKNPKAFFQAVSDEELQKMRAK
jgi:hypothetical protein